MSRFPQFVPYSVVVAYLMLILACQPPGVAAYPSSPQTLQANLVSLSTGSCLDVPGAVNSPGLALPQAPCITPAEQLFAFVGQADGTYIVHAPGSFNLCLDINDSGSLVQNYCLPTAAQKWLPAVNALGASSLINRQNNQCLVTTTAASGVPAGFSTAACAAVATQQFSYGNTQPYTLPAAPGARTAPVVPFASPTVGLWQAGYYNGLPYRIMFPVGYDPTHFIYPIALFLHGDGESGADNMLQLKNDMWALPTDMDFRAKVPLILVAPQCPTTDYWGNPLSPVATPTETLTIALMQMLVAALPVDSTHVSVTGLSMGGIGSWDMINRYPVLFAAAAPIAGAGYIADVPNLVNVPLLAVHGGADPTISPIFDEEMYAAIHRLGGPMIYIEVPGWGHDVWDGTYPLTTFWQWMYQQKHI